MFIQYPRARSMFTRRINCTELATQVLLRLHRVGEPGEEACHWLAALSDITQIQRVTAELKDKSAAIENTLEGVLITSADGKICFVNKAFEQTTGYLLAEVQGKNPKLLQSGKHPVGFYQERWREIRENGCWRGRNMEPARQR